MYDARENVKFRGGYLSRHVNSRWPTQACCLALEFRKSFMDEWSGRLDRERFDELKDSFARVVAALEDRIDG